MSCSGRLMRSQYRETGRRASLTETSSDSGSSSCWSTGATRRVAKMSPGSSRTGRRLTVAAAAPGTMFIARLDVAERVLARLQRLPEAGHVAVPEDAEDAREEGIGATVALDRLDFEEGDDGLRGRQATGLAHGGRVPPGYADVATNVNDCTALSTAGQDGFREGSLLP